MKIGMKLNKFRALRTLKRAQGRTAGQLSRSKRSTGSAALVAAVAAAAGVLPLTAVQAAQTPLQARSDQRMQHVVYDVENVTHITGGNGVITTINFGEGEEVLSYGSGYSDAWEFAHSGNHLFLKPKRTDASTNLVVVTNRRQYALDLSVTPDKSKVTYVLSYRYPQEERKVQERQQEQARIEESLSHAGEVTEAMYRAGHKYYAARFDKNNIGMSFVPNSMFDDCRRTYMYLGHNATRPAVYALQEDGRELRVPDYMQGDVLIVEGVYGILRLRSGNGVVEITRGGSSKDGEDFEAARSSFYAGHCPLENLMGTNTGTVSHRVVREVVR